MTHRQLHNQNPPSMDNEAHKRTWNTWDSLRESQQVGESPYKVILAWLASASSEQLFWSQSLLCSLTCLL